MFCIQNLNSVCNLFFMDFCFDFNFSCYLVTKAFFVFYMCFVVLYRYYMKMLLCVYKNY